MIKLLKFILLLFSFSFITAQSIVEKSRLINSLIGLDFYSVENSIKSIEPTTYTQLFLKINKLIKHNGQLKAVDSLDNFSLVLEYNLNKTPELYILNEIRFGYYNFLNNLNDKIALKYFNNAYNNSKKEYKGLLKLSILGILELYRMQPIQTVKSHNDYLNEFEKLIENRNDSIAYTYYKTALLAKAIPFNESYFDLSKILIKILNEDLSKAYRAKYLDALGQLYRVKGSINKITKKYLDSSYFFYEKLVQLDDSRINRFSKFNAYLELAHLEALNRKSFKSKRFLKKSKNYFNKSDSLKSKFDYQRWKTYYVHEVLNEIDSAYISLNEAFMLGAELNVYSNIKQLAELNIELDTAEKEKQILIEQQQKEQNRNIALGLGGSLALGSIIALLIFKNTKRKQKLAEQEKEIESQKLATVLKEQELTAIDAMIEGQEKERQRIANDLHDDLGGLMATVKLHFNALKDKKSPELFNKTNSLIDEAYQKVRSVAHAKNSGVIAKHGLLKSVKEMADKISIANKLNIEVIDYGLDTRLENSLELTIFRIVQELLSNAVKHANASEISVHITNHEESLNLMVEDNGIGFNQNQITKTKKGMGISSIDKRVEHLDGKLTIESEKNKGTTVIIDIPL